MSRGRTVATGSGSSSGNTSSSSSISMGASSTSISAGGWGALPRADPALARSRFTALALPRRPVRASSKSSFKDLVGRLRLSDPISFGPVRDWCGLLWRAHGCFFKVKLPARPSRLAGTIVVVTRRSLLSAIDRTREGCLPLSAGSRPRSHAPPPRCTKGESPVASRTSARAVARRRTRRFGDNLHNPPRPMGFPRDVAGGDRVPGVATPRARVACEPATRPLRHRSVVPNLSSALIRRTR